MIIHKHSGNDFLAETKCGVRLEAVQKTNNHSIDSLDTRYSNEGIIRCDGCFEVYEYITIFR